MPAGKTEADLAAFVAGSNKTQFFAYAELSDGSYKLAALSGMTSGTKVATETITANDKTIDTNKVVTNGTVYLVANGTGYTVYTGYAAMPATNVTDNGSNGGMYILSNSTTNVASMVVIQQTSGGTTSSYFTLLGADYTSKVASDKTVVKTFNAIVNGEVTTIDVDASLNPAVGTFYFGSTEKNGYVSVLGTTEALADVAALTGVNLQTATTQIVVAGTTKLMLADGVLTMTDGTNTKVGYVAKDFKAYSLNLVTGASNYGILTEETLDDTTATALGAAGDFVLVLTDKNSEITTLYFMDLA